MEPLIGGGGYFYNLLISWAIGCTTRTKGQISVCVQNAVSVVIIWLGLQTVLSKLRRKPFLVQLGLGLRNW